MSDLRIVARFPKVHFRRKIKRLNFKMDCFLMEWFENYFYTNNLVFGCQREGQRLSKK